MAAPGKAQCHGDTHSTEIKAQGSRPTVPVPSGRSRHCAYATGAPACEAGAAATEKVTVDGDGCGCGGPAVTVALGGVRAMYTSASLRSPKCVRVWHVLGSGLSKEGGGHSRPYL